MKWKILLLMIGSIFLFITGLQAEEISIPREELEEYLQRMEKDRETIKKLQEENISLQQRIQECLLQINASQKESSGQIGIYIGADVTYPLGGNAIIMYKFQEWGLYGIGGYNNGFNIGVGAIFKMR